jgi:hypothetical protein
MGKTTPPDHDRGGDAVVLAWIMLSLSTPLLVLRLISKSAVLKRLALDDVLMFLAWVNAILLSVTLQGAYHFGLGRHYEYLAMTKAYGILKWLYTAQAFGLLGPLLGRSSFNLYLLAIIGKARLKLRYWLWTWLVLGIILNVGITITLYAACGVDMSVIIK